MTWRDRSVLAVVPARGGSKGLPRKNLRLVGGRSLVAHAAETVKQLRWLDGAVLSTDDPEIAEEGARNGLAVPFLRPADLASDTALGVDAWRHAWLASESFYERQFDCSVLLQPTSPLRRPEDVEMTLERMLSGAHRAAATVSPVPGHYVPEKMLRIDNGVLCFVHPEGAKHSNRQSAAACYVRNGLCYAAVRHAVVVSRQIVERDCAAVVTEGYVANIDEPVDLIVADYLATRTSTNKTSPGRSWLV
jgi:CMP-N,N'-diacetyllegionaminic acid synthase